MVTADSGLGQIAPPDDARSILAAEKQAREQAAVAEFNKQLNLICREFRVTFQVGVTVWGNGQTTPQVVFVAQD